MKVLRALRPLLRGLRRLDHGIGRLRSRRRILIEARIPMNLAVLRPLLHVLRRDPRLTVWFTGVERDDLRLAFAELGVSNQVISRRAAARRRIDLYINADPWEAASLWRVDKRLNFFHGVAGKYDLDCPTHLPLGFDRYDCVAFPNEGRRNAYVAAGIVSEDRAVLVGYPKADVLIAESGQARPAAAALGLDSSRPTAIFAPTFSPASALHVAGERIIETLLASGCNVIAKLHDRSMDTDPRYSGGIDWPQRLARFNGPRFLFAASGDSTPYVLASDVMVTDHSSIGFEFCALDRPLIVFDVPELITSARINRQKVELLRSAATVVASAPALEAAVRNALAAPDTRSPERRRAAEEVFYHPGSATARALRLVYDLLQLPPATDLATSVPRKEAAPAA
ncbi:MAG: CDP-glycerol glycerophosphotransferase family protein [Burkholderiales bacterium]